LAENEIQRGGLIDLNDRLCSVDLMKEYLHLW
jgi:hypothetical protein